MFRENDHIGAEGSEFRGEAALGVDLKIEESGGDGGAGAKGKQHNEKATGFAPKRRRIMRQNMARLAARGSAIIRLAR